ncbi:MAG: hypothetical protein ACRDTD_07440, partial [Pseudonocardiaceae bacterium]
RWSVCSPEGNANGIVSQPALPSLLTNNPHIALCRNQLRLLTRKFKPADSALRPAQSGDVPAASF